MKTKGEAHFAPGPIIPPEASPLKTLTVAMTVMCYLACLAIGALIVIDRAVDNWTGGLAREVTVQVRKVKNTDFDAEIAKAARLLEVTPGILAVDVLDRSAGTRLLEPWLGTIGDLDQLPVPRLISVTVDPSARPDFDALAASLSREVKGASLDTHRRWQAELTRMASVLEALAYAVLALICLSAIAIVVFATRSVLDANRGIIDVLHLVGARDRFIAGQVEGRFLKTGFAAGLLGMFGGIVTFFLLTLLAPVAGQAGVGEASAGLLFAPPDIAWRSYAALFAVPVIATLISLMTARVALMRTLRPSR
jgi:cell division transport system permease protein